MGVWDEEEAYLKRKADEKESHCSVSEKNYYNYSSDETGYWRSLHRAKKLNWSTGVQGSKSIVSRGSVH